MGMRMIGGLMMGLGTAGDEEEDMEGEVEVLGEVAGTEGEEAVGLGQDGDAGGWNGRETSLLVLLARRWGMISVCLQAGGFEICWYRS